MRKWILMLGALLAVSVVAWAVPTGPGGTIYFGSSNYQWPNSRTYNAYYYLDVDSNWDPLTTQGACVFITTVHNDDGSAEQTYGRKNGSPELWGGPAGYH